MKIIVLGTRGIPHVPGGVEKHCEKLYPLLAAKGCAVTVLARMPYVSAREPYEFEGVQVIPTWCPKHKYLEALYHTFFGCFKARAIGADIVHIHACGPSLFTPLAKVLGFTVVITNHGPEYERKKWNAFAKAFLKVCEWVSMKTADQVITISETIKEHLARQYKRDDIVVIPNGVDTDEHGLGGGHSEREGCVRRSLSTKAGRISVDPSASTQDDSGCLDALTKFNLTPQKYILAVGRFVPEKGFHDLVEAYTRMGRGMGHGARGMGKAEKNQYKLVIVGDADHEDEYSRALKAAGAQDPTIVLTGFQTGAPLEALFRDAALFVLPSYYEGLPITLLEAMSYGLSCIVTDIPANKNVRLDDARTFRPGDIEALSRLIAHYLATPLSDAEKQAQITYIKETFNWLTIAAKTLCVYEDVRGK